jgi:4'-phosphopantetheinyl transferase
MVESLRPGVVHVWYVIFDSMPEIGAPASLLTPDERSRAADFVFEADRKAFTITRSLLHTLAGEYLNQPGASLRFRYSTLGKPFLPGPLAFNVSRTRFASVLAFTHGQAVGIDIEWLQPEIVTDELVKHVFSNDEIRRFYGCPEQARPALFFDIWTRKEAYLKAIGTGLSTPLQSITVLDPSVGSHNLLRLELRIPRHIAAIAVEGPIETIQCYSWEHLLLTDRKTI